MKTSLVPLPMLLDAPVHPPQFPVVNAIYQLTAAFSFCTNQCCKWQNLVKWKWNLNFRYFYLIYFIFVHQKNNNNLSLTDITYILSEWVDYWLYLKTLVFNFTNMTFLTSSGDMWQQLPGIISIKVQHHYFLQL